MRILAVLPNLAHGGAEGTLLMLTEEWAKTEAVMLAVFEQGRHYREPPGFPLVDLNVPASEVRAVQLANLLRRATRLSRLRREFRPDVVVAFQGAVFTAIISQAMRGRGRLVASIRTNPHRYGGRLLKSLHLGLNLADRVVVAAEDIAAVLRSGAGGRPESWVTVIPNPVRSLSVDFAGPVEVPDRFVLQVGRMYDVKNQGLTIEAFRRLKRDPRFRDLKLVLVGEGPDLEQNRTLVADLGLGQEVQFPGFVGDPGPWLHRCSAVVLSSRFEGWPNVLAEAVSLGCRIVATDCDYGPREILAGYPHGRLTAVGDPAALAAGLADVLEGPKPNLPSQEIPTRWHLNVVAAQWLEVFRSISAVQPTSTE